MIDVLLELPSSDGESRFAATAVRPGRDAKAGSVLLLGAFVESRTWSPRGELAEAPRPPYEDFDVRWHRLAWRVSAAEQLRDRLTAWLDAPAELEAELSGVGDQSFVLRLGAREDLILTHGKVAATLRYSGGRMCRGEWRFVVDQSCVRLLRDSLERLLAAEGVRGET